MPDAYDITRSDDGYGILMDKLSGTNLEKMIREQPEERLTLIDRFAEAVKELHRYDMSDNGLPDAADISLSVCDRLDGSFCTDNERKLIRAVFECIPHAGTFIHGDCHPGNAMSDGGNLQFFDLTFTGKGDPVFDLIAMYSHYVFLPSFVTDEEYETENGMKKAEAGALYDRFLDTYYSGNNNIDLPLVKEWITGIHAARICLASVIIPGVFTDEMLAEAKRRAVIFSAEHCGNKSAPFTMPV